MIRQSGHGNSLHSNRSRIPLEIVADNVGRHDYEEARNRLLGPRMVSAVHRMMARLAEQSHDATRSMPFFRMSCYARNSTCYDIESALFCKIVSPVPHHNRQRTIVPSITL